MTMRFSIKPVSVDVDPTKYSISYSMILHTFGSNKDSYYALTYCKPQNLV